MPSQIVEVIRDLDQQKNVSTLDVAALAARAQPLARHTAYGGLSFFSNVRNRSAAQSVVFGSERVRQKNLSPTQQAIVEKLDSTLATVRDYLKIAPLISVKRTIGDNGRFEPKCTLYLSTQRSDNIRQAYLWARTLKDYEPRSPGPELHLLCIPEWPEQNRQVLIFPEERLTIVLGSDYVGEVKMGFLRMAMWEAKQEGMLAVHAGSKLVRVRQQDGTLKLYGMLLFGLSGTGKTTHSCHDHGLTGEGEGLEILQDDIVFLQKDGSALGTEQGFYLKTEGITAENQPIISKGLTTPQALFENVMVDAEGNVDFANTALGSNGRAVILRKALAPHVSEEINLPPASELDGLVIAFITRRMTVLPIASSLSPGQAAAAFMLGESIETSAGDPRRAGQSVRVVGTNPFIIGDGAEDGNWFHEFLNANEGKTKSYLLNTGGVGEIVERDGQGNPVTKQRSLRVAIPEMAAIIRGIVGRTIEWEGEPEFGTQIPASVDGVDIAKFRLDKFYSREQANGYVTKLKEERRDWLARFPGLHPEIAEMLP